MKKSKLKLLALVAIVSCAGCFTAPPPGHKTIVIQRYDGGYDYVVMPPKKAQ